MRALLASSVLIPVVHSVSQCSASSFTEDRDGQLCSGLHSKPASSLEECVQAACADDAEVWQWCDKADNCGASAGGCWVGNANNCNPFGSFSSKSRPSVPAPPPPPRGTWKRTQCGSPAGSADIPTKWGLEISAKQQPWTAYPRPNMVRSASVTNLEKLRDTGDVDTWINLNGLWEWEPATSSDPSFGAHLTSSILVPFPVESCLSGVAPKKSIWLPKTMWYRQTFERPKWKDSSHRTLLHFGAVDWQTTVYLNGVKLGSHTGGYDGFSYDLTDHLSSSNELIVFVFDPSDSGAQPNGKQRASAIESPGSDTYSPSSGIWQTVWLEGVPQQHIQSLDIDQASLDTLTFTVNANGGADVAFSIFDGGNIVGSGNGKVGQPISFKLSNAKLWSPDAPNLYDLQVKMGDDSVIAYFGLRTLVLGGGPDKHIPAEPFRENFDRPYGDHPACGAGGCKLDASKTHVDCEVKCNATDGCVGYVFAPGNCETGVADAICWLKDTPVGGYTRNCRQSRLVARTEYSTKPILNSKYTFLAGFLDQSWWPDGQYTAPSDEALAYDLEATKMFGFNMIRLHQKVNPERWYYHADRLGLVVFQDTPQKYGGATADTVPLFVEDVKAMVKGRGSHPSIVQWTAFNEADCFAVFNTPPNDIAGITALFKQLDPKRLVDTASGEWVPDSAKHIGDVYDIHSYPEPGDPMPTHNMYAMVGEFGGIGAFIAGKEWLPKGCFTYLPTDTPSQQAGKYVEMATTLESRVDHISASVYTQTTDVELECDGFLAYDRSNKFNDEDTKTIHDANQAIIQASEKLGVAQAIV